MKTLLLMRHARSGWKNPDLADHERPLSKRGHKHALFMGEVLLEKELLPQIIIASSALRVRETVAGLVKSSGFAGDIEFNDALYLAEPEAYLAALHLLPDSIERAMVVGHNPGLEGLLKLVSGRIDSIETSSIAYLCLPIQQWSELSNETDGELVELLHQRELRGEKEENQKKGRKGEKKDKGKSPDGQDHKDRKSGGSKKHKKQNS